ncbi:MAG: hypothetical protein ACRDLP_16370 [Solirubrobacteraceae bacterium]
MGLARAFVGRVPLGWHEITKVEAVRGLLPAPTNVGVAFYVGRRRLIFWASPRDADEIMALARRSLPDRVVSSSGRKLVL